MTVIRPNSVSGITSITAQANEINFFRSNGTLAGLQLNGVNFNTTAGISTFNNLNVGGVLTYQDVTNVDSLGIGTFRTGINVSGGQLDVGSNIKLGNAGVITATTFSGAISGTTGTFTGDVDIADKIIHTGDTDTAIRFPAADTITAETGGSERLRIDSAGKITTNTTGTIVADYNSSNSGGAYVQYDIGANGANIGYLGAASHLSGGGSNTDLGIRAENNLDIAVGGSSRKVFIYNSGNIQLNTTGTLAVDFNSSNGAGAYFNFDIGASGANIGYLGAASHLVSGAATADLGIRSTQNFVISTGGATERLRITSTGELTMTSGATKEFIAVNSTNNNTRGIISMQGKTSGGDVVTLKIGGYGDTQRGEIFTHSNHGLGFATNNAATQMLLNTSGNLLVGTTVDSNNKMTMYGTNTSIVMQNAATGTGSGNGFYLGNGAGTLAYVWNYENDEIRFATNNTERGRFESGGAFQVQDDIKIMTAGKGIDFSATSNSSGSMGSEVLDDYEEGSWTPSFPNGSGGNQTLSNHTSDYVKIGRFVYAFVYMALSGQPPNNGSLWMIGGLPYAPNASGLVHHGFGNIQYVAGYSYQHWRPLVASNSRVYFHRTDGSNSTLSNAMVRNEGMSHWIMGFCYMTA